MVRIDDPGGSGMPAQLTRMSSRPYSSTQDAISASAVCSSAGDPANPTAASPSWVISATVRDTASSSRPLTTTPAPRCASNRATSRPMPRLPPTTTAARPASTRSLTPANPAMGPAGDRGEGSGNVGGDDAAQTEPMVGSPESDGRDDRSVVRGLAAAPGEYRDRCRLSGVVPGVAPGDPGTDADDGGLR